MRYSLFISAIVLVFCSCADDSKRYLEYFKMSEEVLERSNKQISSQNHTLSEAIDSRLVDPNSSEEIKIWQPYAKKVEMNSLDLYQYIEALVTDLM